MTAQGTLFPRRPRRSRGRARRGLDATLVAMRATGRIDAVDAGLIALARIAADELDDATRDTEESRYTRGVLIARYHAVLSHLLARPDGDDIGTELAALFAGVDDGAQPRPPD